MKYIGKEYSDADFIAVGTALYFCIGWRKGCVDNEKVEELEDENAVMTRMTEANETLKEANWRIFVKLFTKKE